MSYPSGWALVPVPAREKGPRTPGWQDRTFGESDFGPTDNAGVKLGEPSNGLVDIDLDAPEAVKIAPFFLPDTGRVHGRPGKPRSHFFYYAPLKAEAFKDAAKVTLLEIRSTGQMTLIPPSTHPGGDVLRWEVEEEPARVDAQGLRSLVVAAAIATYLSRLWPKNGPLTNQHDLAGLVAGYLIDRGVAPPAVGKIVEIAATVAGDDNVPDRVRFARDTCAKHQAGGRTTGAPKLADEIGREAVDVIDGWLGRDGDLDKIKDRVKARERMLRDVRRELDAEDRPPAAIPTPRTLADRLTDPVADVLWRIADFLPVDCRVVVAAQFKGGKTTLIGNVTRSLVDGDPFLGRFQVAPVARSVVLLDFEMSPRQLDAWLRDQQIRHADRVVVVPLRGSASAFDIRMPDVRARWVEQLRAAACDFLIVDCLRPIMDALGMNEHTEAGLLLTALDGLMKDAGIAEAIVVHHMGHTGERSRGDSRLRDWPDVEWRLVREDDNPASDRFISAFGRDVDVPESRLGFDATTRRLSIEGGSRRDSKVDAALADVMRVIENATRPLSKNQIERALADSDHPRAVIRRALKAGRVEGSLRLEAGDRGADLFSKGIDRVDVPF